MAESGRNSIVSKASSWARVWRMNGLTQDETAEPIRETMFCSHARTGKREKHFPGSAVHEQVWQPLPSLLSIAINIILYYVISTMKFIYIIFTS